MTTQFQKQIDERGLANGVGRGGQGDHAPETYFNFRTKNGPTFSISKIRDMLFMDVQKL